MATAPAEWSEVSEFDESWSRTGWILLILSLLFHVLLGIIYWKWVEAAEANRIPPQALSTKLISEGELRAIQRAANPSLPLNQKAAPQIVETEFVPSKEKPRDHARFLGERTQRVEKEMVSDKFGSVTGGSTAKIKKESSTPSEKTLKSEKLLQKWGLGNPLQMTESEQLTPEESSQKGELARGSMDGVRKDVAIGARTILSTDEYVYASFFNRVKAEVGPRWEPIIRKILQEQGRRIGGGSFSTETQFWLNASGDLLRVEVSKSSGQSVLDEAARESIRRMPRMPNPPAALRESDGTYRMQLGFMVFLEQGGGVRTDYIPDPRL